MRELPREALQVAARTLEQMPETPRTRRHGPALSGWSAMARARWKLVDQFERDGKRYLLAVRSEAAIEGMELLSPRERQAVLCAARGHSNKVVACELGIATSTVGVLLSRATAKLGARSRKELLAKLAMCQDGPTPGRRCM